jgi:hypothetical protein
LLAQVEAGDTDALARLRAINRVIADSPALLAREQQAINPTAPAIADVLASESDGRSPDLRPQVVANALLGLHRALLDYVRRRILADDEPMRLAADIRRMTTEATGLLEHGLADYAVKTEPNVGQPGRVS